MINGKKISWLILFFLFASISALIFYLIFVNLAKLVLYLNVLNGFKMGLFIMFISAMSKHKLPKSYIPGETFRLELSND